MVGWTPWPHAVWAGTGACPYVWKRTLRDSIDSMRLVPGHILHIYVSFFILIWYLFFSTYSTSIDATHQTAEICRRLCLKKHLFAVEGMFKCQRSGVKCKACVRAVFRPVFFIPHNGMSYAGQMHAYLVLPACHRVYLKQCEVFCLFEHFIGRAG